MTRDPSFDAKMFDAKIKELFPFPPATFETDLVLTAYRETTVTRRSDEHLFVGKELANQRGYFTTRLDTYLEDIASLTVNRGHGIVGRVIQDIRFYDSGTEHTEQSGLVDLRRRDGRHFLLIDDRLRPVAGGMAAVRISFLESEERPEVSLFLSPQAYGAELNNLAGFLRSEDGRALLDSQSALFCLMRSAIADRYGSEVGWGSRVANVIPVWAGEESSFTLIFEGGRKFSVEPKYLDEVCHLEINTREIR